MVYQLVTSIATYSLLAPAANELVVMKLITFSGVANSEDITAANLAIVA